jgi:hypothetical protein
MTRGKALSAIACVVVWGGVTACSLNNESTHHAADMSELWENPVDLEQRDLFYGPGGKALAPDSLARFTLKKAKDHGRSAGYTVVDAQGREWSAKLGVESRVEVTVSRIVWAVGFHQPSQYYVPRWILTQDGKDSVQPPARFRFDDGPMKKKSEWSWRDNPFDGTQQLAGLFALMVMFNNWDLKTEQNTVYEQHNEHGKERRWYVVRDLGASLGRSGRLIVHTKDDPEAFESEPFITGVEDSLVSFGFRQSWRKPWGEHFVKAADLRWICGLLRRLSDAQWRDAFRAGGFTDAEADRYIRRLQQKIADGLAVEA